MRPFRRREMAYPRGDPVEEIDRLILLHREDQRANNLLHDEAVDTERRAVEAQIAAQAVQTRTQLAADLDVEEINRLLAERLVYVPAQRQCE